MTFANAVFFKLFSPTNPGMQSVPCRLSRSISSESHRSRSSGVNLGSKLYLMSFKDLSITSKSSGKQKTFPKFGPLTPIAKLCCSYFPVYGSNECL